MSIEKIVKRFIIHGIVILLFCWFFWDIINIISPFLIFIPLIAAAISCIGFLVYALAYAGTHLKTIWHMALAPLVIISITIGLALFFPFTAVTLGLDFWANLNARNEVRALIESGALPPESESPYLIKLPWRYKHLSKGGGEVAIEKFDGQNFYLFYTFRGIVDNYSGFIYMPDRPPPDGYYIQVEKMRDGWYYCASN